MSKTRPALVDPFGRRHNYLRISITDRCNFRCAYCMPQEEMEWTPKSEILSFEEIERLSRLFVSLGVNKVRLTGGEPTLRKGVVDLVASLRSIKGLDSILMTTNGDALSSMVGSLRASGLNGLNISLDTLKPDRFYEITRRNRLDRVLAGIADALAAGFESVKINVVAMAGVNEDELCDFVDHFRNDPVEIRFIEFMPFLSNGWHKGRILSYAEMRRSIESKYEITPVKLGDSAVAKVFDIKGATAQVGFITSMTDHFCSGCNRMRLTADGRLKVCLFAKTGPSLRDAMRSGATDDEIVDTIRIALNGKWKAHPPMNRLTEVNDLPMITIGG